jgi:hypothetical protein
MMGYTLGQQGVIDSQHLRGWCRKFIESLPPLNYNVFVYLLSFMREVLALGDYNRCIIAYKLLDKLL